MLSLLKKFGGKKTHEPSKTTFKIKLKPKKKSTSLFTKTFHPPSTDSFINDGSIVISQGELKQSFIHISKEPFIFAFHSALSSIECMLNAKTKRGSVESIIDSINLQCHLSPVHLSFPHTCLCVCAGHLLAHLCTLKAISVVLC